MIPAKLNFKPNQSDMWYLTKMVFQIICGDGDHTAQFDEQLRLISAGSREEAFIKAQLLGGREEEMFFNSDQRLVQWQFITVSELYLLDNLIDGAELYSRIEEKDNADSYLHFIRRKSDQLKLGESAGMLNM